MRHEPGVNVPGHAASVMSQCHGSTTHDEHVCDDASAGVPIEVGDG
jgi:hypothetical protein